MRKIYDISPEINSNTNVWPGDTPFEHHVSLSTAKGDNITLSSITTTLHIGAHADAPNHYYNCSDGISNVELSNYIGKCQVIEINIAKNQRIKVEHINGKEISAKRILFKTNSFPDHKNWNKDFVSLSGEIINYLASKNVVLIGIDTPSIDLFNDKELESHSAVYKNGLSILEGIVLKDINEGIYELIALPLKITAADASPVRAILREFI